MFNGNKIYKIDKLGNKKLFRGIIPGLTIRFKGKNSIIELHEPLPKFSKCRFRIKDNTLISIGSSNQKIKKLCINGESNQKYIIGKNFFTYGCELTAASENNLTISIGNNCMFAKNIILRASDGHSVIDKKSKNVVNYGKNITIGDNVWIAGNVIVLKGVEIGNNSIIGHGSVVTKNCEEFCAYAGNPAKLIKKEVTWLREAPFIPLFNEPVDIVYTYVNSNDLKWQEKKSFWAKQLGVKFDINNCRYNDNEELKYSLRSLEKYASWINKIYIITDSQIPSWINLNNSKIKIIDHTEIIDNQYLPTFNSNAILHNIHKIKGLSEYFLYADDDCFLVKHIYPEDFIVNEDLKPIFRFGAKYHKKDTSQFHQMQLNADNLLLKINKNTINYTSHHCFDMYKKSDIESCQKLFSSEISETIKNKFRTNSDIERIIYSKFACLNNNGHAKYLRPSNKLLCLLQEIIKILFNLPLRDTLVIFPQTNNKLKKIKKIKPKMLCINENEETTDVDRANMKVFLDYLFPEKSTFEK